MDLAISNDNNRLSRVGAELALVGALALAAFLLRLAIDPFIGDRRQYLPAYGAVAVAAWLMGWRAGALTAFACLVSGESFVQHGTDAGRGMALSYMGFLTVSTVIVSLAECLRRQREQAALTAAELRAAERRQSEFMALLGHELRSPLATIAMSGRMLKSGNLDAAAVRGTAEMVERQTERMTRLVGDLLDVARLQTGKLSLHPALLDVSLLVQEAAAEVRVVAHGRQQRVVLRQPADPGFIHGDPVRLHQVVVNLLQNACKFSPARCDVEVTLRGDDGQVTISVRDSGIGIAASQLERIFEPFVQLPAGRGEERGLGLGLPLTRELVRMHGGSVRALSAGPGRGSEFVVSLPRAALPGLVPPPIRERAGAGTPPAAQRAAGRRVLVVDDNADAAATLALLLRLEGHQAFTAADGKAALELAALQRPDVVFLDIGLPDMNGLELAARLRELLGAPATLVALTGWGGDENQRRSRAAGCDAHLTKPVDRAAIEAALALVHDAPAAAAAPLRRRPAGPIGAGESP